MTNRHVRRAFADYFRAKELSYLLWDEHGHDLPAGSMCALREKQYWQRGQQAFGVLRRHLDARTIAFQLRALDRYVFQPRYRKEHKERCFDDSTWRKSRHPAIRELGMQIEALRETAKAFSAELDKLGLTMKVNAGDFAGSAEDVLSRLMRIDHILVSELCTTGGLRGLLDLHSAEAQWTTLAEKLTWLRRARVHGVTTAKVSEAVIDILVSKGYSALAATGAVREGVEALLDFDLAQA